MTVRYVLPLPDPDDSEQVEQIAALAYAWSFGAHNGGADWERTKARAFANGGYCDIIVGRCYGLARDILTMQRDQVREVEDT